MNLVTAFINIIKQKKGSPTKADWKDARSLVRNTKLFSGICGAGNRKQRLHIAFNAMVPKTQHLSNIARYRA